MPKSDLTISLNEVLFYFTRAGFGVKAPIGVSEDFARSNILAAQNGFDPSECSILALDNLDLKKSSLSIKFEKNSKSSHLFCTEEKVLSSLEASVSCVDWIEFNGLDGELKISNVDCPFLIIAALGASQCSGVKASWTDQDNNSFEVNFIDDGKWEIISSSETSIESVSYTHLTLPTILLV